MATKWISPTWRMPENSNQSKFDNYNLDFDGSSEYIDLGTDLFTGAIPQITVSLWAKVSSTNPTGGVVLIGKDAVTNGDRNFMIQIVGTTLFFQTSTNGTNLISQTFDTTGYNFLDQQWHHFAFVYKSGSAGSAEKSIYIDGVQRVTDTSSLSDLSNTSTVAINIGRRNTSFRYFSGSINNVSIFDYALSETQVKYLFNNNAGGSTPNPQNPMAIPGNSPIAYYDLGGSSTGDAAASSPNTLTVPNSSVQSATVFNFVSADGDRINVGPSGPVGTGPINSINGAITISIWVKTTSTSGNEYPIMRDFTGSDWRFRRRSDTNRIHLAFSNTSNDTLNVELTGTNDPQGNPYISIVDGKWHHLVGIYNGTNTAELYIDSVLQGTNTIANFGTLSTTARTVIGGYNNSNGNPLTGAGSWNGDLSNAQIWNTNLSSAEVITLYNNGKPYLGTQPQANNLKGWWKMNIDTSNWDGSNWEIGEAQANYSTALSFSGASQYIDTPSINLGTENTISFWAKRTGVDFDGAVLGSPNVNSNFYTIFITSVENLLYRIGSSPVPTFNNADIVSTLRSNEWFHCALVRNNSGADILCYINGDLKQTLTGIANSSNDTIVENIGARSINDFEITGNLSNIALFNTALDASAVSTIYNNGTPETSISSSPTAWWKLDNTTITDSSGNGNTGTNNGATQVSSSVSTLNGISSGMTTANLVNSDLERSIPYSSYSMYLSATNDWIQTSGPNLTSAFSFSCWIKTSSALTEHVWCGFDSSSAKTFLRLTGGTGTVANIRAKFFLAGGGAVNLQNDGTSVTYNDGNWHHIAFFTDGLTTTNGAKLYFDGQLLGQATLTSAGIHSTTKNIIGSNSDSGATSGNYNGYLSNMAFFDKVLTEDQILSIYNGGVPNDISSLSPVSWWSFSGDSYYDGSKWITPDLGSATNNGEGNNVPTTALVGDGPGSTANGVATSMDIPSNLQGNAPNSSKNAFSVNMNAADRVEDVAPTP